MNVILAPGIPAAMADPGLIRASIEAAVEDIRSETVGMIRGDAALPDNLAGWYSIERKLREGMRADAAGNVPAGLLTSRFTKVFEKKYPANDAYALPQRAETPIGAEHTEYFLTDASGSTAIWNGGVQQNVPEIRTSLDTELREVAGFISVVNVDLREMWAANFMNRPEILSAARKIAAQRRIHLQERNADFWQGRPGTEVYGVLNHPGIADNYVTTVLTASGTTAEQFYQAMMGAYRFVKDNTSEIGMVDTLHISPILIRAGQDKLFSSSTNETAWSRFTRETGVTIVEARSLSGAGPGDQHVGFWRNSQDEDSAYLDIPMGPTLLAPVTADPRATTYYMIDLWAGFKSMQKSDVSRTYFAV